MRANGRPCAEMANRREMAVDAGRRLSLGKITIGAEIWQFAREKAWHGDLSRYMAIHARIWQFTREYISSCGNNLMIGHFDLNTVDAGTSGLREYVKSCGNMFDAAAWQFAREIRWKCMAVPPRATFRRRNTSRLLTDALGQAQVAPVNIIDSREHEIPAYSTPTSRT